MPRLQRLQYPGAYHHVMNRGAAKRDIFLDVRDRRLFLLLLAEAVEKFGIEIHSYCLMNNHYHLLVRTPEANLDLAIHHLASNYVRTFNARHGRDGPMFRSRYTSLVVDSEQYLAAVSRYIHRNPLDIGVAELVGYPWSSLAVFTGDRECPSWLKTGEVLRLTGGREAYEGFVGGPFNGEVERVMAMRKRPLAVGRPGFEESLLSKADDVAA